MAIFKESQKTESSPYERLAGAFNRTKSYRSPSSEKLTDFLLSFARKIDTEDEAAERVRLQSMFSMCRRHRGATPSDLFGVFNSQGSVWLEHPSFAELYGTNIFQSLVRGAEANFTQAKVRLEIKGVGNNFESRSIEKIANGVYESLRGTAWTETTEQQLFYAMALKLNAFVISRFNPYKGNSTEKIPEFGEQAYETSGVYICPACETSGEYNSETGVMCQTCGNEDNLTLIDEPTEQAEEVVGGFGEMPSGEVETIIADGFDCRFDDSQGRCGDLSDAQWFEYRYLVDKEELRRIFPHLQKLDNVPEWSVPRQWVMALKKYAPSACYPSSEWDKRQHEVREIYLRPNVYADYIAPEPCAVGEYSIQRNGMLAEDFPDGVLVIVVNNEVAAIYPADLREVVKSAVWLADPTSGWGLGMRAGLPIQKKINHLDNMNMEGIDRALRGAIVYDPQAISGAALEGANTNIPLRSDFERTAPIGEYFAPLNVSGLSQDVMLYLSTQHDLIQKVMGVPDAAIGEANPNNRTATGQQLEANKATGLLIPAKQSQARAMEGWCRDQLRLVQKHYSKDRIREEFGTQFGEEWLDDELETFISADLDTQLTISFVQGSEIPQTRAEREAKLAMFITSGMIPPTPENLSKLISHAGIDGIDVGAYDSNIKVAQKRFTFLYETWRAQSDAYDAAYLDMENALIDPVTGQRMVDEMTGMPIPNPILEQFLESEDMQIIEEAEDHGIQVGYWQEKARDLLAVSGNSSPLLRELCRLMIVSHQQAQFNQTAKMSALMGLAGVPQATAQQQMEGAAQQQGAEQEQANAERDRQHSQEDKQQEREFQREDKASDQAHEKEMAQMQAQAKTKP